MKQGEVTLLGIRHHGPGSARAVGAALDQLRPDTVLIEGPPEADAIIGLAAEKTMVPPVALLAHLADDPAKAAFWPFAVFSPEWVALRWAVERDVPVRFIDLPAAHTFALADGPSEAPGGASDGPSADPIAALAHAAGHDDPERWWEDVIEHRSPGIDALAPFGAVAEAMTALRETWGSGAGSVADADADADAEAEGQAGVGVGRDELREAYMRQQIRTARRTHGTVAVVCGAWHVPALQAMPPVAQDRALLAGLPRKPKTDITWVPWTHRRLSQHTGYGAGVDAPGWYHHLFTSERDTLARWMTRVAELLRAEDHPVSSAHVIEAVRLADTLAVLRGRPLPGLSETLDAVRSVMCDGSDVALALVGERLVIGDALGEVPEEAPAVPLQRDLTRLQRTLRLKAEPTERELTLDLRKETDAERSRLLHRLRLLGIDWGTPARSAVNSTGTFRESWRLRWQPEFAVRIVEAAQWGTTVEGAAVGKVTEEALRATELAQLTGLIERSLLADLPGALPAVMRLLADRAALDTDIAHLAAALPALVRSLRYGDVRSTDSSALTGVATGLAERISVGLPPACTGLDADGAATMRAHLDAVHTAIALLAADAAAAETADVATADTGGGVNGRGRGIADRWAAALSSIVAREPTGGPATGVPGLLRGRAVRLLLDDSRLDAAEAGRRLGLVLSAAGSPADAAGWIEGFLAGGGALLLHDQALLGLIDDWLTGVHPDTFTDLLPVLRRTFAALEAPVRRTIGERVAAGPLGAAPPASAAAGADLDDDRADAALPTLALLLGLPAAAPALVVRIPRQPDRRAS